jgi:hypothetical protein
MASRSSRARASGFRSKRCSARHPSPISAATRSAAPTASCIDANWASVRRLESIVIAAIEEGCIGETVAALEAAEALAHCADPEARRVLEISRDETEHARAFGCAGACCARWLRVCRSAAARAGARRRVPQVGAEHAAARRLLSNTAIAPSSPP